MSTQTTVPSLRDRLMAALSAAEHFAAESPVLPESIRTEEHHAFGFVPGTYERPTGVVLYFHEALDALQAFADTYGVPVLEELRDEGNTVYTYADGDLDGVPYRAWSLTAVPVEAAEQVSA